MATICCEGDCEAHILFSFIFLFSQNIGFVQWRASLGTSHSEFNFQPLFLLPVIFHERNIDWLIDFIW